MAVEKFSKYPLLTDLWTSSPRQVPQYSPDPEYTSMVRPSLITWILLIKDEELVGHSSVMTHGESSSDLSRQTGSQLWNHMCKKPIVTLEVLQMQLRSTLSSSDLNHWPVKGIKPAVICVSDLLCCSDNIRQLLLGWAQPWAICRDQIICPGVHPDHLFAVSHTTFNNHYMN